MEKQTPEVVNRHLWASCYHCREGKNIFHLALHQPESAEISTVTIINILMDGLKRLYIINVQPYLLNHHVLYI